MKTVAYNADEVFEIAEQIERNGAAFYRAAAASAPPDARDFLLRLAKQEDEHERTFAALRAEIVRQASVAEDTDGVVAAYLRALAGQYVFLKQQAPDEALGGATTLDEILVQAIQKEKDSIVLYLGLMDVLADEADRDKIRRIVREEQKHLTELLERQRA